MRVQDVLVMALEGARHWTGRLFADLEEADWSFSPAPGLAHPVWICGHLAVAQHLLVHVRCLGSSVLDDAFVRRFPIGGPVPSVATGGYPPRAEIMQVMDRVHQQTIEAVRGMSDALLAEPAYGANGQPHPHYDNKLGAVLHCGRHEAFHAGQLATIRRLRGKAFLR